MHVAKFTRTIDIQPDINEIMMKLTEQCMSFSVLLTHDNAEIDREEHQLIIYKMKVNTRTDIFTSHTILCDIRIKCNNYVYVSPSGLSDSAADSHV